MFEGKGKELNLWFFKDDFDGWGVGSFVVGSWEFFGIDFDFFNFDFWEEFVFDDFGDVNGFVDSFIVSFDVDFFGVFVELGYYSEDVVYNWFFFNVDDVFFSYFWYFWKFCC